MSATASLTERWMDRVHGDYVYNRRVEVLAQQLSEALPSGARVLDVGCGDGLISSLVAKRRPDIDIEGIDILLRPKTHIPVTKFDGTTIPFEDHAFDAVMFVDVLHHTVDPRILLREAKRVARRCVVLKDHTKDGFLAGSTLRFMDWVGNARHGVVLPYNYWPERRWRAAFDELSMTVSHWNQDVPLYPKWAAWAFTRKLHFIARLHPR